MSAILKQNGGHRKCYLKWMFRHTEEKRQRAYYCFLNKEFAHGQNCQNSKKWGKQLSKTKKKTQAWCCQNAWQFFKRFKNGNTYKNAQICLKTDKTVKAVEKIPKATPKLSKYTKLLICRICFIAVKMTQPLNVSTLPKL